MYQVSIKIERSAITVRPRNEITPDLLVQARESSPLASIEKALRILHSERDAILASEDHPKRIMEDDDDEDDEI